jgi:hypothetical protein
LAGGGLSGSFIIGRDESAARVPSLEDEPRLTFPTPTQPIVASATPGKEGEGGAAGLWIVPGAALVVAALLGRFLRKK